MTTACFGLASVPFSRGNPASRSLERRLTGTRPSSSRATAASSSATATGHADVVLAAKLRPDVVLLDVSMPGPGGIEVTQRILQRSPATRVLILTVHEDASLLKGALRVGAAGYIVKRAVQSELISALRAVAAGEMYVHPSMTRSLVRLTGSAPGGSLPRDTELTRRELDVLRLVAQGHTNRQVAEELGIGIRTVETHRANVMGKLGLETRIDLVRYALDHKLVS